MTQSQDQAINTVANPEVVVDLGHGRWMIDRGLHQGHEALFFEPAPAPGPFMQRAPHFAPLDMVQPGTVCIRFDRPEAVTFLRWWLARLQDPDSAPADPAAFSAAHAPAPAEIEGLVDDLIRVYCDRSARNHAQHEQEARTALLDAYAPPAETRPVVPDEVRRSLPVVHIWTGDRITPHRLAAELRDYQEFHPARGRLDWVMLEAAKFIEAVVGQSETVAPNPAPETTGGLTRAARYTRLADEISAGLERPNWRPTRSMIEDARNYLRQAAKERQATFVLAAEGGR